MSSIRPRMDGSEKMNSKMANNKESTGPKRAGCGIWLLKWMTSKKLSKR